MVSNLSNFAAVIALIFTGLSLLGTKNQLNISEQGQVTDRYNAAIANLGSGTIDIRLGGIYALQRLMIDSPRDRPTIIAVLCAFVRDQSASSSQPVTAPAGSLPTDLQAALTLGGARSYYVGFGSLKIDVLQGLGLVRCAALWGVRKPRVMVMSGSPDDYNVALYRQGYHTILKPYFAAGTWQDVSNPPGTWLALTSLTEFERQYQAHPDINAALIPNDENATPIIGFLEQHIKARTFPVTGLDATVSGLQNILAGYQCGTVYKPVYLEAQAAAALALYLRAGVRPPAGLVTFPITDPQTNRPVPSALLTPVWVTAANMRSVVMNDHVVPVAKLCTPQFAADCAKAGIPAS